MAKRSSNKVESTSRPHTMVKRLNAVAELLERLAADARLSDDAALDDILTEANLIRATIASAGPSGDGEALSALKALVTWGQEPDPDSKSPREQQLAIAWRRAREVIAKADDTP